VAPNPNKTELRYTSKNPKILTPEITIGMPVFNQEKIIQKNILSILTNTKSNFELIIINDASTDSTENKIIELLSKEIYVVCPNLTELRVYTNNVSRFETFCDNFAIESSRADFFLEIQADMCMEQQGYDLRLLSGIKAFGDLVGVSGRGVHPISDAIREYERTAGSDRSRGKTITRHVMNVFRSRIRSFILNRISQDPGTSVDTMESNSEPSTFSLQENFLDLGSTGQLGDLIEQKLRANDLHERKIFVGETIMRGPLLLSLEKLRILGGWDDGGFFQGFDDHNFCLKAYIQKSFRVGYIPIGFASPIADGTTRKKKSWQYEFSVLKNLIQIQQKRKKSALYAATINSPSNLAKPEIRFF